MVAVAMFLKSQLISLKLTSKTPKVGMFMRMEQATATIILMSILTLTHRFPFRVLLPNRGSRNQNPGGLKIYLISSLFKYQLRCRPRIWPGVTTPAPMVGDIWIAGLARNNKGKNERGYMEILHESVYPLISLAFVLGLKHGMDADHLATIDGLTRFNTAAGRMRLARLCGLLFSLGHGSVVCIVAVAASLLFHHASIPSWMDDVGTLLSAFFLLLLGVLNLYAVLSTPSHKMVQMVGIKGRWLSSLKSAGHPALVALVGALFALSFDTLSQAALFSITATRYGGMAYALLLAICFMIGMIVTDAVNGLWISHLLRRADASARIASRIMGVTVALLSLTVAGLGLSRRFLPETAAWQEGRELLIGASLIVIVAANFLFAKYAQHRTVAAA